MAELQEQILDLEGRLLQEEIKVQGWAVFFLCKQRMLTPTGLALYPELPCVPGLAKGRWHRLDSRILRDEVGFV